MNKFTGHTPGPWWFRTFHGTEEDNAQAKRLGLTPVPALSNEGHRFLMSGYEGEEKRIALVECQTPFKRGNGYVTKCLERDANAELLAAAPRLLADNQRLIEALRDLIDNAGQHSVRYEDFSKARALLAELEADK